MAVKHLAQIAPDGEVLYVKFIVACAVYLFTVSMCVVYVTSMCSVFHSWWPVLTLSSVSSYTRLASF